MIFKWDYRRWSDIRSPIISSHIKGILFCYWIFLMRMDNKKAIVDQITLHIYHIYSSLSASYRYFFVSTVPVFFSHLRIFYLLFSSVLLCPAYMWFSSYLSYLGVPRGSWLLCLFMSVFSLGKFQAVISCQFSPPCLFFLFSSGTSVTWIIDHFTMSHTSLIRSPCLTNLSSVSPVHFSAMANLWLNTCSFWLFYCLILSFSFDIFYHFRVFAEFFISLSISKKPKTKLLSVKSIVYVSYECDPLCQVLIF